MGEVVFMGVKKLVMANKFNKIAGGVGAVLSLVIIYLGQEGKPLYDFARFVNNVIDEV